MIGLAIHVSNGTLKYPIISLSSRSEATYLPITSMRSFYGREGRGSVPKLFSRVLGLGGEKKKTNNNRESNESVGCWLKRKTLQHLWVLQRRHTKLLDPKPYSSSFRVSPPGIAHEVPMKRFHVSPYYE
jgi:hypothetical protein